MRLRISTLIEASSELFTEADIVEIVGQETIDRYRAERPGGMFKAYVLCHEATATPRVGGKVRPVEFGRSAVRSAFEKVKRGLKFFWKHPDPRNPRASRDEYGEIVGSAEREMDGKMATIAVGWFPRERVPDVKRADAISMEAVWNLLDDGANLVADTVESITGIALFPRAEGIKPGFPGANELATVLAHTEEVELTTATEPNSRRAPSPPDEDDFEDFKSFRRGVKRYNVWPSHLWTPEQIVGRRITSKDNISSFVDGDRDVQDYIERSIVGPIVADYEAQLRESRKQVAELRKRVAAVDAQPKIDELAKKLEIPERVVKLAKARLDQFQPGEDMEADIKAFLLQQQKEDERLNEIYRTPTPAHEKPRPSLGAPPPEDDKNPFLPPEER